MEGRGPEILMAFVVDASAAVSWILPDENDATARAAHLRLLEGEQAVAPVQWWFEVRNVLLVAERRGRVTPEETDASLVVLTNLPVRIAALSAGRHALTLAREHRLTFYDASYLALAIEEDLPLATLDRDLRAAAAKEGVSLVGS